MNIARTSTACLDDMCVITMHGVDQLVGKRVLKKAVVSKRLYIVAFSRCASNVLREKNLQCLFAMK